LSFYTSNKKWFFETFFVNINVRVYMEKCFTNFLNIFKCVFRNICTYTYGSKWIYDVVGISFMVKVIMIGMLTMLRRDINIVRCV
jgi:hypothetical protein